MTIFLYFFHRNICCGYSVESPSWGDSNEYPNGMFSWQIKKVPRKNVSYLSTKTQCGYSLEAPRRYASLCNHKICFVEKQENYQYILLGEKKKILESFFWGQLFITEPKYTYTKMSLRLLSTWSSLTKDYEIAWLCAYRGMCGNWIEIWSLLKVYTVSVQIVNYHDLKKSITLSYEVTKLLGHTVKPVIVATSIKQATCIKQAWLQFPKKANLLKFTYTCIKQAPVLSKHIWIISWVLA